MEELDEDGNPINKKPPKIIEPPKKDKSGRISSKHDQMIELEPQPLPVASTAVVLCFANYRESFINIQSFDLKTRRRAGLKTYNLTGKPTKLFQLDMSHILVGTEGGKIEHWSIDDDKQIKIFDAHPESDAGISIIKELHSKSPLLRNALPDH